MKETEKVAEKVDGNEWKKDINSINTIDNYAAHQSNYGVKMLTLIGNHLREREWIDLWCSIWYGIECGVMKPVLSMHFALDSSLDLSLCMMPPLGSLCWPSFTPHQTFFLYIFYAVSFVGKVFDSMWLAGEEGGRAGIRDCQWVYKCHSIKVESTTRCAHHHVPALLSVRRTWMCLDTRREPSALCKSFMCLRVCVCECVCVGHVL